MTEDKYLSEKIPSHCHSAQEIRTVNIIMGYRMGGIFSVYKILAPELSKYFQINTLTLDNHLRQDSIPGINETDLRATSPLKGKKLLRFIINFISVALKHRLSTFIVNNQSIAIIVYLVSKMLGYTYVVHQHSTIKESIETKDGLSRGIYLFMLRCAFRGAKHVICNSKHIELELLDILNLRNTVTIYNPIDVRSIIEGAQKPLDSNFDPTCFNFVSVGRLSYEKGYDVLIKAVHNLSLETNRKFKVYIIGSGDLYHDLNDLISLLGVGDRVCLTGFLYEPYQFINACDCYLNTSRWEGFGLTLTYAMLLKKPIIASKTGASMEILSNKNYLFEIDNSEELCELMINIMNNLKQDDALIHQNYLKASQFDINYIGKEFARVLAC